jgi:CheY-like chemotaxis protein
MTTILIVDDNSTSRRMLGYTLSKHGYTVVTAENGRDALAQLDTQPVDLILSDIAMPEMDGVAFLKAVRADARWRDLPVIMVTASGQDQDRVEAQASGSDGFLTKPVGSYELLDLVGQFVLTRHTGERP